MGKGSRHENCKRTTNQIIEDIVRSAVAIISFLILMVSCQDVERMKKPKDLIPQDKMVDVLVEVSLLQAARNYNKVMLEEKGIDPERYIWDKYEIDSLQFVTSSQYYAENYRQYERIYDQAKEKLEVYRVHYDSLEQIMRQERDSLRAIGKDEPLEFKKTEQPSRQIDTIPTL